MNWGWIGRAWWSKMGDEITEDEQLFNIEPEEGKQWENYSGIWMGWEGEGQVVEIINERQEVWNMVSFSEE